MIVSGQIPYISFNIKAKVDRLHLKRVNKVDPEGDLILDGASMLNRTRLDEWSRRTHKRKFTHSKGVSIRPSNFGSGSWSALSSHYIDEDDMEQIRSHLRQMHNQLMEESWRERMKGAVAALAAISGLAIGTFKAWAALSCSAKGIFISLKCGEVALQADGFSFKLLTAMQVVTPPVAVGVGVAALVYFIPWDEFFSWLGGWLKRIFTGIWDNICSLWNKIWSIILTWRSQQRSSQYNCY